MTTKHQPDQADFRAILPEDIDWKPFPAFPPGARLAVIPAAGHLSNIEQPTVFNEIVLGFLAAASQS